MDQTRALDLQKGGSDLRHPTQALGQRAEGEGYEKAGWVMRPLGVGDRFTGHRGWVRSGGPGAGPGRAETRMISKKNKIFFILIVLKIFFA